MKNICITCSIIFCFLIISCTKNLSEEIVPVVPVPVVPIVPVVPAVSYTQFTVTQARFVQSIKFIKKEVTYLTSNPLLKSVRIFNYDAGNRCIEIKIGTIDSSKTNPIFNLIQTLTLNYIGASILPSTFSSVRTVFPNLITVYYYTYNNQGFKTKDSVMVKNMAGDPAYRVVNYVYDSGRVHTTPFLSGFPMDNIPFDTLSILQNGNIEKLVSRIKMSAGDRIVNYTFTYDSNISPYNKLNIANSLYFENSSIGIGYNVPLETHYMGVTTNNMTSWTSGSFTVTFKYVYDADKYPLRKEMVIPGSTNPYQVTLFEY